MPFECRNSACGMCKATINHGTVRLGPHLDSALSAEERAAGKTLLCCAEPEGDIELLRTPGRMRYSFHRGCTRPG